MLCPNGLTVENKTLSAKEGIHISVPIWIHNFDQTIEGATQQIMFKVSTQSTS